MKEKKRGAFADQNKFVTFALDSVSLSTAQRHVKKDRLSNCMETVKWRVNRILMVNILWSRSTENEFAKYKRTCTNGG